ncbi:MAG TPA: hypothetical protein VFV08_09290 [Puia sp.]|nr:hypothetical protein [Puia sp.]
MSDATHQQFNKRNTLFFRTLCLYLLMYVLFISDYANNYRILWHLNQPLKYLSEKLGLLLNKLFFDPNFKEIRFFDSYWTYSKLLSFLLIAFIASAIWTRIDQARGSRKLFVYSYTFARYYLFVTLMLYGLWKIFETQFVMGPYEFLLPINYYTPQIMYWTSVSVSRSYQMFGGFIEIFAGILLLSRRTTTLGALITLTVMVNILVLDLGYDVPIKIMVVHLLIFNLLILWPDFKKLYRFFVLRGTETLEIMPSILANKKYQKLSYCVKAVFIGLVVIPQLKSNIETKYRLNHPAYKELVGIHRIDTTYQLPGTMHANLNNPKSWKAFTIGAGESFYVLFHGDSLSRYQLEVDTQNKTLRVISWDSSFNGHLHYQNLDSTIWLFEGNLGGDTLRFVSKQYDIFKNRLFKDHEKFIWSWSPSSPPNYSLH